MIQARIKSLPFLFSYCHELHNLIECGSLRGVWPKPRYVLVWTLLNLVLWPGGPRRPHTPCPWFLPADSAMERLREKPIHSGRRSGTRDRIHVIPDPLSSWNSNANLIAAATESSVIKRIKKHLYCDYASCQNVSWNRKWKQPLCSSYRSFFLHYA